MAVDRTLETATTYWYEENDRTRDIVGIIGDCASLFEAQADQFIEVYEGTVSPD